MTNSVSEILGVGSDRRLPITLTCGSAADVLVLICVYLPPCQDTLREQEWNDELAGLGEDIRMLIQRFSVDGKLSLVLLGDMNVEPMELGGGGDADVPMTARRKLWTKFQVEHQLIIMNPLAMSDMPQEVWLPVREKMVRIGNGGTHHCGGRGRAIDIIACMGSLDAEFG